MASSLLDAIYRVYSLNHKAVYLANIVRLFEGLIIMVALLLDISLVNMVLLYLTPRVLSLTYKLIDTKSLFEFHFRIKNADWRLFKKVLLPSITFMSFPAGNAIIFQGFSLVVNKFFGAELLVIYNTTRTLTSFLTQVLGAILQAVWPEFSIAYGKKDYLRMRTLHRKAFVVSTATALAISIFLLIFGDAIYSIWTQGRVKFEFDLMLAFLFLLIFRNIWSTSSVVLMSTNNHTTLGLLYVSSALVSIIVSLVIAKIFPTIVLLTCCLLIVEVTLSVYAVRKGIAITKDNFIGLILSVKTIFKRQTLYN